MSRTKRTNEVKILYVENHSVFAATVVRQFLSQHTVTVVPTVKDARAARASGRFDVLLVDFDLDDGKGDVFVREVRAADTRIPIVGVSSHEDGNAALLAAGASATCGKMEFDRIGFILERLYV